MLPRERKVADLIVYNIEVFLIDFGFFFLLLALCTIPRAIFLLPVVQLGCDVTVT